MSALLHADDLVLCGESEEDQEALIRRFAKVFKRRAPKVNADKSKVKVLGTEVSVDVRNWRMFRSFSILDLFWINLVWMKRMLQESDV